MKNPIQTTSPKSTMAPWHVMTALTLVCVIFGTTVAYGIHQYTMHQFIVDSKSKSESMMQLTKSFVSLYSEIINKHGGNNGSTKIVPATFRAKAFNNFNEQLADQHSFRALAIGMPGREIETRAADQDMESRLLSMQTQTSKTIQTTIVDEDNAKLFRTMMPMIASSSSCVNCHNNIQTVQPQWKLGDMMGALVIDRDVSVPLRQNLSISILSGIASTVLLFIFVHALLQHSRLKKQSAEFKRQAETDYLTSCVNRRALYDQAAETFIRGETNPAVLSIDLDQFGFVNEQFGPAIGDKVLIEFVNVVHQIIDADDIFARTGGEEFAIYVPDSTHSQMTLLTEKICQTVSAYPFQFDGKQISITVSIGAAMAERTERFDLDRWLRRADSNLSLAKKHGCNQAMLPSKAA